MDPVHSSDNISAETNSVGLLSETTFQMDPQSPGFDFAKLLRKVEKLIADSKQKDAKLKNALFVIERLNKQMEGLQNELQTKDDLVSELKQEVFQLEKQIKENLVHIKNYAVLQASYKALQEKNDKRMRQSRAKDDEMQEEIKKLNQTNFTLSSENNRLRGVERESRNFDQSNFEREVKILKDKVRKQEKDLQYCEKENERLKSLNKHLKEKFEELHRNMQIKRMEEFVPDEHLETQNDLFDLNKYSHIVADDDRRDTSIVTLPPFKRMLHLSITNCYEFENYKRVRTWPKTGIRIFTRRKEHRKFESQSHIMYVNPKYNPVSGSQSQDKLRRMFRHLSNKLREVQDTLEFKVSHLESSINQRLKEKGLLVYMLMLNCKKMELLRKSELLTASYRMNNLQLKLSTQAFLSSEHKN